MEKSKLGTHKRIVTRKFARSLTENESKKITGGMQNSSCLTDYDSDNC